MNRKCARCASPNHPIRFRKNSPHGSKSPVIRGFERLQQVFCDKPFKTGTPPALTQATPSFGDLGTGRPGIPHFIRAQRAHRFGGLDTGRSRFPFFTPGSRTIAALPFWGPWYRQAGDSSFIPGDGPPAASGHRPRCRPTGRATDAPPPPSAATPCRSNAPASSRPCR